MTLTDHESTMATLKVGVVVMAATCIAALIAVAFDLISSGSSAVQILFIALPALTGTAFVIMFLMTLYRQKSRVRIAVLGPSGAGKTTFVTALFHCMSRVNARSIVFSPYWRETTDAVASNFSAIRDGRFLDATHGIFRVDVKFHLGKRERVFTLEVPDVAGEVFVSDLSGHLRGVDEAISTLLYSDGLIFCLDGAKVREAPSELTDYFVRLFCLRSDRRARLPAIALVVLKSDLLDEAQRDRRSLEEALPELFARLESFGIRYEVFFASALSSVVEVSQSAPTGETELLRPLLWTLERSA